MTERERWHDALRRSEERWQELVNTVDGIVWEADADTFQFLFVSDQAERLLGYPAERWYERGFWAEHIHPVDRAWAVDFCVRQTAEKRPHEFEYRMIAADGRTVWLRDIVSVVVREKEPTLLRGIMVDVTERKQVDEDVLRLASIVQSTNEAVVSVTSGGTISSWNHGAERLYGYTADEAIGSVIDMLAPHDRPDEIRGFLERVLQGERIEQVETERLRKDGSIVAISLSAFAIVDSGGAIVGAAAIAHDVTARRKAEAMRDGQNRILEMIATGAPLEDTLASLVRLIESQSEGMLCSVLLLGDDGLHLRHGAAPSLPDGYIKAIDGAPIGPRAGSCGTAMYRREPVIVTDILEDPLWSDYRDLAAQYGLRACWSTPIMSADGSVLGSFAMYYHDVRSPNAAESRLIDVATQVAGIAIQRRLSEEALHDTEEQLRQAQKMEAIGRLAGGVAHDFNNLLTAITGYSSLLEQELSPNDAELGDDVRAIQQAAASATELVSQLLAFSRRQVRQPQALDVNEVVERVVPMLRRLIGEQVSLVTKLDDRIGRVWADPGQIQQMIINLAVNARDAMPRGGTLRIVTGDVELDAHAAARRVGLSPGRHVAIRVEDTGIGMSAAIRERIFEPFFTTKEAGHGTGLGLATVYGIVAQSKGHIEVESEPGHGTTVHVLLPVATGSIVATEERPAPAATPRGTETVLLVEDEPAVRALTKTVLERNGYVVIDAGTGAEAIDLLSTPGRVIDLLATDVVMPGMSGPDLARRLGAIRPGTPVLFLSGYSEQSGGELGLGELGIEEGVAFLAKPFKPDDIARAVRSILDAGRSRVGNSPLLGERERQVRSGRPS